MVCLYVCQAVCLLHRLKITCIYYKLRRWLQLKGSVKESNMFHNITMKLRKSLVKPVTRQNISSCLVLPPEIVMHDAFNVIL